MGDLSSAPPPALRGDDHVRGPDGAPVVLVYALFSDLMIRGMTAGAMR